MRAGEIKVPGKKPTQTSLQDALDYLHRSVTSKLELELDAKSHVFDQLQRTMSNADHQLLSESLKDYVQEFGPFINPSDRQGLIKKYESMVQTKFDWSLEKSFAKVPFQSERQLSKEPISRTKPKINTEKISQSYHQAVQNHPLQKFLNGIDQAMLENKARKIPSEWVSPEKLTNLQKKDYQVVQQALNKYNSDHFAHLDAKAKSEVIHQLEKIASPSGSRLLQSYHLPRTKVWSQDPTKSENQQKFQVRLKGNDFEQLTKDRDNINYYQITILSFTYDTDFDAVKKANPDQLKTSEQKEKVPYIQIDGKFSRTARRWRIQKNEVQRVLC